jgi:lipopolysaccharide/colanic/teichoic acid biosynthesis glycosyltransferase
MSTVSFVRPAVAGSLGGPRGFLGAGNAIGSPSPTAAAAVHSPAGSFAGLGDIVASRRRKIVSVALGLVFTIFSTAVLIHQGRALDAGWIVLWFAIVFLVGGHNGVGARARTVKIPLVSALVVTGALAFLVGFTPYQVVPEDGGFRILGSLWSLTFAVVLLHALIPVLLPQRSLRVVLDREASARSGAEAGGTDGALRSRGREVLVIGDRLLDDDSTFVDLVAAEVRRLDIEAVELTFPLDAEVLRRLSWSLRRADVELHLPLFDLGLDPHRVHTLDRTRSSELLISPARPGLRVRTVKRLFDDVVAGVLVVVLAPLMIAAAVAIKVTMPGPVLYRQERVGLDGKPFRIIKFRSMIVGADSQLAALLRSQETSDQPLFKVDSDPRITRLGHLLRRTSIDELPQLFNVLGGSMSLVGPRPQRDGEVALYTGSDHHRLGVRPGMTGLWQVSGRSDLPWEQAREFDLYYAHNWNLANDLRILLRTFGAVVRAAGAR